MTDDEHIFDTFIAATEDMDGCLVPCTVMLLLYLAPLLVFVGGLFLFEGEIRVGAAVIGVGLLIAAVTIGSVASWWRRFRNRRSKDGPSAR